MKNDTKQLKRGFVEIPYNLQRAVENLSSPDPLLKLYSELTFIKKGNEYVCKQSGGLAIAKKADGWTVFNNSGKLPIPSGGLYIQICHRHQLSTKGNQADLLKAYTIAADLLGYYWNPNDDDGGGEESNLQDVLQVPPLVVDDVKPYEPNDDGGDLKISFTLGYAKPESGATLGVIEYLSKKISAPNFKYSDLAKYGIKPVLYSTNVSGRKFSYDRSRPCYATIAGESIKIKTPKNKNKAFKNLYAQNKGNRLYLFDQLPKVGKVCLIVAGETDAIAINYHFNHLGIYAVCLNGETSSINPVLVEMLRGRFDDVLTLFDNDKTGIEQAELQAKKHGLPAVKLWEYTTNKKFNDVCDFLQELGIDDFLKILSYEIDTRHAIVKESGNPFAVAVPNALKINIDKYLGETAKKGFFNDSPLSYLKGFIQQEPSLLLQSAMGTGKTTGLFKMVIDHLRNLYFDADFLQSIEVKRTIIFTPTTGIADQQAQKIKEDYDIDVKVIKAGFIPSDFDREDKVLICTYQSAFKIWHLVEDAFLIIDESHTLTDWATFNSPANRLLLEYSKMAQRCVVVSATPDLRLTTDVCPLWNFTLCQVKQNPVFAQKIEITPVYYSGVTESDLFNSINERKTSSEPAILKKNNVKILETYKAIAESTGKTFDIFSSKKPIYKENNANYNSLVKESKLASKPDFLGVTSVAEFGMSIEDSIEQVFTVNEISQNSLIQLAGRGRIDYETGKNSVIKVDAYTKAPDDKESLKTPFKILDTVEMMKDRFTAWQTLADFANKHDDDNVLSFEITNPVNLKKSEVPSIYKSQLTGRWEVNTIGLLQLEAQREQANRTKQQFFSSLTNRFDNVILKDPVFLGLQEDEAAQQIKKDLSQAKAEREAQAFEIVKQTDKAGKLPFLLEAIHETTGNSDLKKDIKNTIQIKKELTIEARELLGDSPDLFKNVAFDKPLKQYFKLKALSIPTSKILPLITDFQEKRTDDSFTNWTNYLIVGLEIAIYKKDLKRLKGDNINHIEDYKKIFKAFDRINKDMSKAQILKRMQAATDGKYLDGKKALSKLRELYVVESKRKKTTVKGKEVKIAVYKITGKRNPFQLLDQHGIKKADYLAGFLDGSTGAVILKKTGKKGDS